MAHQAVAMIDQIVVDKGSWGRAWGIVSEAFDEPPWAHVQRSVHRTETPLSFSELLSEIQISAITSWHKDLKTLADASKGDGGSTDEKRKRKPPKGDRGSGALPDNKRGGGAASPAVPAKK